MSDLLETALSKTIETDSGKVAGKRILASLVAEAVTTGKITFIGEDKPSTISVKDWMEFVKWVYQYLEPPTIKQDLKVEGDLTWKQFVESAKGPG